MSKYKWMPILKTGTFTDKNNQTVTIEKSHLDHMVNSYDPDMKKANFVIEHPKFDDIGFGFPSAIKRVGDFLLALPEKVSDELKDAVNSGRLPGRSVTIDKKGLTLKNISFLPPTVQPAVDGLGSYAFSAPDEESVSLQIVFDGDESHFAEGDNDKIEFQKYEVSQWPFKGIERIFRGLKNWWIEQHGKEEADKIFPEYELDETGTAPSIFEKDPTPLNEFSKPTIIIDEGNMKLTEEQIAKMQADLEALQNTNTDLTNKLKTANLTLEFSALKDKRTEALTFVNADGMKKRITPAIKDAVVDAMVALDNNGTFEFAAPEGGELKKVNALDTFKTVLGMLPELDLDVELAKKGEEVDPAFTEAQKFGKEAASLVNV